MKKLTYLFVMLILLGGCFHHAPRKFNSGGPPQPELFNDFKSTGKEDARLFQTMGVDYFKQNDWPRAKTYLTKAVKLDPNLYWSWYYLGLLNINNQEGCNYLKKSTEVKPEFPIPYYWMAYYHCRIKEDPEAISLFRKYIELAKGKLGEEDRLRASKEALKELLDGKEGEVLTMIRQPSQKEAAKK